MTLAEKLRFLADRAEDGKEFYLRGLTTKFDSIGNMVFENHSGEWIYSDIKFNIIDYRDVKLKPQWEFTEDEKVILRNFPDDYQWIARDEISQGLFVYTSKPTKSEQSWSCMDNVISLAVFNHLFQSIQWSDAEPCEFRRFL